jgi:hypothetical protein
MLFTCPYQRASELKDLGIKPTIFSTAKRRRTNWRPLEQEFVTRHIVCTSPFDAAPGASLAQALSHRVHSFIAEYYPSHRGNTIVHSVLSCCRGGLDVERCDQGVSRRLCLPIDSDGSLEIV